RTSGRFRANRMAMESSMPVSASIRICFSIFLPPCLCSLSAVFGGGNPDPQTVDLHTLVRRDQQVAPSVDDPGLHQIAPLRVHLDSGVGGLDREVLGVDQVGRGQRPLAKGLAAGGLERLHPLLRHAAVPQHAAHLACGDSQRLRVPALLVFLDPLAQVVVDRLHHLHAARPLQSAAQGGLKGLPLLGGGHGRLCAEHCVNELLMELVRLPAVKQGV
ncbi:riboflavin synthase, partial [Dysosmobacter welbionis]